MLTYLTRVVPFGRVTALNLVVAVVAMPSAIAQDLPPDDGGFEIETASSQDGGFWSQPGRYIGGSLGTVQANGDIIDRHINALALDLDLPATAGLKTVLSVDLYDYDVTYTQELKAHIADRRHNCAAHPPPTAQEDGGPGAAHLRAECAEVESLTPTRAVEVSGDDTDMREAYVQWEVADFATLRVGRQAFVWGQFDFFSPVSFLSPIRTNGTQPRVTKADLAYGQDALQVSLFPTGKLEMQFIHAPEMRLDPEQLDSFERFADTCADIAGFVRFAPNQKCDDSKPDIADSDMSVMRLTYIGDEVTWAITAMEGIDQFGEPIREAKLSDTNCGAGVPFCLRDDEGRQFYRSQAFGIEMSKRLNDRWTVRAELTQQEVRDALDLYLLDDARCGDETTPGRDGCVDATHRLGQAMLAADGQIYFTSDQHIMGVGGLYEGDIWTVNLQLMVFDFAPKEARDEILERAEEAGRGPLDDDDDGSGAAPLFSVTRKLGEDNQGYVGVGAGAFFNAYGLGIYGGWTFDETLQIGGLLGTTVNIADGGSHLENEYYQGVDEGDTLLQIGVNYLF